MKTFAILLCALFMFLIWDACNMPQQPEKWVAMVYVNGSYVGAKEITLSNGGFKGEVIRDTVEKNGVAQYEEIVLTVKTSW